ncbi:MAG: class I SAM-dependent methyltransferase [Longimicrobiales bacterium]
MMRGSGDLFRYAECTGCGSLQALEPPRDPGALYDEGYCAFRNQPDPAPPWWLERAIRRARSKHLLGGVHPIGWLAARLWGAPRFLEWVRQAGAGLDSAILDVGCGNGRLLLAMRDAGFTDLTGIDPYLRAPAPRAPGITLRRQSIRDAEGAFDLIMFHHSLEHVPNPATDLRDAARLLKPRGAIVVRIPIAGSEVWRRYREHWVQLDAPRHLFIPSADGMKRLAERAELTVELTVQDSDAFQFWGSELYRRGIPLDGAELKAFFTATELAGFEREATRLNAQGRGDQGIFYMRRA